MSLILLLAGFHFIINLSVNDLFAPLLLFIISSGLAALMFFINKSLAKGKEWARDVAILLFMVLPLGILKAGIFIQDRLSLNDLILKIIMGTVFGLIPAAYLLFNKEVKSFCKIKS